MMFRPKTNALIQEVAQTDAACSFFRRVVNYKVDEDRSVMRVRLYWDTSYADGVEIPYQDYNNRIMKACYGTHDSPTFRAFHTYHYLKDRGLLKVWFDKARALGSTTPHYA